MSLFFLSACTITNTQQTSGLHASKVEKRKKSTNNKDNLSPVLIQIIQSPDRLRIILYSDVCFQPNGHLTMECEQQLTGVINTIKRYGDGLIQLIGYTDDIYDSQMADEISQRQANSVVAFLWAKWFGSQRLRAVGFASHDPIASNQSVKASAANRRVEIILVR